LRNKKIVIIDYQLGNLYSVKNALLSLGWNPIISSDKDQIRNAEALILPGVGAFGNAMANLSKMDLINPILDHIQSGKPFMGICLGMQLLFTESSEFGNHKGLGIIEGSVAKLFNPSREITIPQIGWNQIKKPNNVDWNNSPLKNISDNSFMYFVHSYYAIPSNINQILTLTNYEEIEYCSAVNFKNIFATQFHPEKSGALGVSIYFEFLKPLNLRYD
jgi:glutamine amidotransferase